MFYLYFWEQDENAFGVGKFFFWAKFTSSVPVFFCLINIKLKLCCFFILPSFVSTILVNFVRYIF